MFTNLEKLANSWLQMYVQLLSTFGFQPIGVLHAWHGIIKSLKGGRNCDNLLDATVQTFGVIVPIYELNKGAI
jgi:hypothetical protein